MIEKLKHAVDKSKMIGTLEHKVLLVKLNVCNFSFNLFKVVCGHDLKV